MTLAQIMRFALLQLDEDPADIDEYADLFRMYANDGYTELIEQYAKPREIFTLHAGECGFVSTADMDILRVAGVMRTRGDRHENLPWMVAEDGTGIFVPVQNEDVEVLAEVRKPPLVEDTDVPCLPESAQTALVSYICWRHLLTGNLAKQSRAQAFLSLYVKQAAALRPQGMGGVHTMRGLYAATDIRR